MLTYNNFGYKSKNVYETHCKNYIEITQTINISQTKPKTHTQQNRFALTGLSPIYYDDNSYGYDDEDGNNRKDDNLEIKKTTKQKHSFIFQLKIVQQLT